MSKMLHIERRDVMIEITSGKLILRFAMVFFIAHCNLTQLKLIKLVNLTSKEPKKQNTLLAVGNFTWNVLSPKVINKMLDTNYQTIRVNSNKHSILAKCKWNFTYFRVFFLSFSLLPLSTVLVAIFFTSNSNPTL